MPGFPRPEEAEASSVPTDDRFGFHNHQRGTPVPPSYRQPCPQVPVHRGQLRSFHRPLHNGELMAQSQHLHLKVCTAAKTMPQRSPNGTWCRKCGEKTEEDQPSMYQSDSNSREPQGVVAVEVINGLPSSGLQTLRYLATVQPNRNQLRSAVYPNL